MVLWGWRRHASPCHCPQGQRDKKQRGPSLPTMLPASLPTLYPSVLNPPGRPCFAPHLTSSQAFPVSRGAGSTLPTRPIGPPIPFFWPHTCFLHYSHPGPSALLTVSHTHLVSMSAGLVCEYKQGKVPRSGLSLWKPRFRASLNGKPPGAHPPSKAGPPPPLPAIPHPRSQPAPPASLSTCPAGTCVQCWRPGVNHHPAPLTGRRRSSLAALQLSPLRLFLSSFLLCPWLNDILHHDTP